MNKEEKQPEDKMMVEIDYVVPKLKRIKLLVLDFDGVLTNNQVIVDENGKESVTCSRGDSLGLDTLQKKTNVKVLVISKETNKVVKARCKKLNIDCIQGQDDKLPILTSELLKRKIDFGDVCYVGNDLNDIDCLKKCGVGVAILGSPDEVMEICGCWRTTFKGGEGAVRQVCNWILHQKLHKIPKAKIPMI